MEMRHRDPEIPSGNPYSNCHAGRGDFGRIMSAIIKNTELGCTIAINGKWGTGKTTFLRMWNQDLIDKGYNTVFLDAWKTEWEENPLVAVLACLDEACNANSSAKKHLESAKKTAASIFQSPARLANAISTIVQGMVGVDAEKIVNELEKLSERAFHDAIDDFKSKEASINRIKNDLEQIAWNANQESTQFPLVFIIDELDRCKPDYSVRMLEILKHFFSVPNIVFICAVDKKHIEDAIRGYYGCEGFDATEYLRRFFDLEVDLPQPDYKEYCEHLYSSYGLDDFFGADERRRGTSKREDDDFKEFITLLAQKSSLSLRQLERIFAFSKLSLTHVSKRLYYYPEIAIFITYLRFFDFDFYNDLKYHRLSIQEVNDKFFSKYYHCIDKYYNHDSSTNNHRTMLFMFCQLLDSYQRDTDLWEEAVYDSTNNKPLFNCQFYTNEELKDGFQYDRHYCYSYELKWLFKVLEFVNIDQ